VHGHAVAVEETAEVEVETDGADAGDTKAVADEGVGGGAAGDPVDSAVAAFLEQVPDKEEIISVTHLGDNSQLLGQLAEDPAMQGGLGAVTAAGSVDDETAEEGGGSGVVGRGEAGEAEAAEIEGEGALLGEAEGLAERAGIAPAAAEGFGG